MQKRIIRGKQSQTQAARRHGSRVARRVAALAARVEPMEGRVLLDATPTIVYLAKSIPLQSASLHAGDPGVSVLHTERDDDDAAPIDLGTNEFTLYDTTYSGADKLWVSTNGLIVLGENSFENTAYLNDALGDTETQAAIAPQWDDWKVPSSGGIFYKFDDNHLTIEWQGLDHFPGMNNFVTFQAVLQLNTNGTPGDIVFNYPDLDAGTIPGEIVSNGGSSTIGIKGKSVLVGNEYQEPYRLLVSNNVFTNPLVQTGKAILIAYNHPPVLTPLADVSVPEGGSVTLTASATDADPDDTVTYEWDLDGVDGWDAVGSSVPFSAAGLDGPTARTVKVRVTDGRGNERISSATVTIRNAAPVTQEDAASGDEDSTLSGNVLANDADPANVAGRPAVDVVTASLSAAPAHGTVVIQPNGDFTYTPEPNYFGIDAFTYTASDGEEDGISGSTRVTLTVNPVNDVPVGTVDRYQTNEDTALTVAAPGLLGNDVDVDRDSLGALLVSGPAHGSLTLNADGSFSYLPNKDFNGDDGFTYRPTDGKATGDVVTVAVRVAPVNDAPVSADDSVATNEDVAVAIAAGGLLANDSDVDGDALAAVVASGPSHGTLTPNPDGTLTYAPAPNFNGADSFTYRASDGSALGNAATVTIRVAPVNDAPAAATDNYELDEDGSLAVDAPGVLGNDTDVDGDPLTVQLVAGPGHGTLTLGSDGSLRYTPAANYNGPDSFTYRAADGLAGSVATVNLTVRNVNDAPQAGDDAYAATQGVPLVVAKPGVLGNDTDVDGDALSAVVKVQPGHGTLTLADDGSFTYAPNAGYSGDDWFTYSASDGSAQSTPATVRFTIAGGNAAPVAVADEKSTAQDTPLTFDPLANDTDADGDTLKLDGTPQPQFGTVTSPDGRTLVYQPRTGFYGTDSFEYRVTDGHGGSAVATVTLTVTRAAAGSVYLINDPTYPGKTALVVNGTDGADNISVSTATGGVQVQLSGASRGTFAPTGRIIVYGYAGNDTLQVAGPVPNAAWLYGDSGNDTLNLGNGGGLAFGGSGDDSINGGGGRDIIVGGNGGDRIVGNPGDDILISAVTIYDSRFSAASHNTAWSKLYAEWTSAHNFATRICSLRDGAAGGLNETFRLNDDTINDDLDSDVLDVLTGASGEDWFIYKLGEDRVTNLNGTELQNDLTIT